MSLPIFGIEGLSLTCKIHGGRIHTLFGGISEWQVLQESPHAYLKHLFSCNKQIVKTDPLSLYIH